MTTCAIALKCERRKSSRKDAKTAKNKNKDKWKEVSFSSLRLCVSLEFTLTAQVEK